MSYLASNAGGTNPVTTTAYGLWGFAMKEPAVRPYPGQFATTSDLLHVVIPRLEIVAEMALRGEHDALNDVCLAVATVADAIGNALHVAEQQ